MPDTKGRLDLTEYAYIDVYAQSGIKVGTPLVIQNSTTRLLKVHIGPTQPDITTQNYIPISAENYKEFYIYAGESGCWVFTGHEGHLHVQEDL